MEKRESKRRQIQLTKMRQGIELVLEGMGVDLEDPNFKDTPQRVAKMYAELLTPEHCNWTTFDSQYNNLVMLRAHKVIALCPHHLMPVELRAYVAYIPEKKVLGLSKLARCVEEQLTTPLMQEELGDRVADTLMEKLSPKGAACILVGEHGCMKFRGVRTDGDVITCALRGVFLQELAAREEVLRLAGAL